MFKISIIFGYVLEVYRKFILISLLVHKKFIYLKIETYTRLPNVC